jgi:hypothetical protein
MLLTAWAEVDPMAAIAYTTENTRGGMATGTVLAAWASRDPESAIAWAEAKHEGDEANPYMVGIIRSLAATNPARIPEILARTVVRGCKRASKICGGPQPPALATPPVARPVEPSPEPARPPAEETRAIVAPPASIRNDTPERSA